MLQKLIYKLLVIGNLLLDKVDLSVFDVKAGNMEALDDYYDRFYKELPERSNNDRISQTYDKLYDNYDRFNG